MSRQVQSLSKQAPLLQAASIRKSFGQGDLEVEILHGVDLSIFPGELVLLMGPSGSGKTTLLSILAGLLRPTSGEVELCYTNITQHGEKHASMVRRERVGFIFQGYNLFPALTALDNVAEVLCMRGLPRHYAREKARAALERVGLDDRTHHLPDQLSGGQKQRVAIARAIAGCPSIIIGDEPTAALDSNTGLSVMSLLRDQVTDDRAVLIVTHDIRLEAFADRIIEIEDGVIIANRPARKHQQVNHHASLHQQNSP